ncbi:phosphatase PAP2 family protein [Bacillus suaedaesalsae]|uniref:Phosphatase PAP2 family protein n=1 Tax=Bacillus suaedaesalsae TaxID=2810349 RepID=A0ABS2DDK3_9BACI|nr:phosphatase PAP2 family protein [Bacillus suaedaesalsae]MBM6616539.1 phosphatase PAP2 family protein [Bacillus suaedaesalsae]
MISTRFSLLYVLLSIMTFIILSMQYDSSSLHTFDSEIASFITTNFPKELLPFFTFITDMGSYDITFPLLIVVSLGLLLYRKFILFFLFIINFYGVRHLNSILKEFFQRDRPPSSYHLVDAHNFSFPSGHSMNSIAFYGLLCWLLLHIPLFRRRIPQFVILVSFSLFILCIGISRIYLRVHFPTDVIAGFLAGSAWFISLILIFHSHSKYVAHKSE